LANVSFVLVRLPAEPDISSRTIANETSALFPTKPDGSRNIDWEWSQGETWKQLEALVASGKVKAIGVSNFSVPYLKKLEETWKIVPAVNQVSLPGRDCLWC
jgi:glycerol 2-dehydrogenase (NADP+)